MQILNQSEPSQIADPTVYQFYPHLLKAFRLHRLALPFPRPFFPLPNPDRRLPSIQRPRAKHQDGARQHFQAQRVPEEPYAQHKTDQLPDIQDDRDRDRAGFGTEQIHTADARELRDGVHEEHDDAPGDDLQQSVLRFRPEMRHVRGCGWHFRQWRRVGEARVLSDQGPHQRGKEREAEEVRVEQILGPVGRVVGVDVLDVGAHEGGEELRDEEDDEAHSEGRGTAFACDFHRFALVKIGQYHVRRVPCTMPMGKRERGEGSVIDLLLTAHPPTRSESRPG